MQRAKPLRGFAGAGVLEVADDFAGATYRVVYTVKFVSAVYALHAFQKGYIEQGLADAVTWLATHAKQHGIDSGCLIGS